jgi:hypothetical protein
MDILIASLDNLGHPEHVQGISSKEGWKEEFELQREGMCKKLDRYKEAIADYFKDEAKKDFIYMMSQMLSNPKLMQQLTGVKSIQ